jgi:hypothetical protein
MGCYHPSEDHLDVCITAATTKNVREIHVASGRWQNYIHWIAAVFGRRAVL